MDALAQGLRNVYIEAGRAGAWTYSDLKTKDSSFSDGPDLDQLKRAYLIHTTRYEAVALKGCYHTMKTVCDHKERYRYDNMKTFVKRDL